jgi:hypothetical protein
MFVMFESDSDVFQVMMLLPTMLQAAKAKHIHFCLHLRQSPLKIHPAVYI